MAGEVAMPGATKTTTTTTANPGFSIVVTTETTTIENQNITNRTVDESIKGGVFHGSVDYNLEGSYI